MKQVKLPEWAKLVSKGKVEIDADGFYPEWLEKLEVKEIDQYWLEMAKQCAKLEVKLTLSGTDMMAEQGGALVLIVNDSSKVDGKWVQSNYEEGHGVDLAGKQAKETFKKVMQIEI